MTATTDAALLSAIVARLRQVDPRLRAVVLIGSCVWAPDLARDVDIVAVTESALPAEVYWDAVAALPKPVEVIVLRAGEKAQGLALAVRTGVLLWGDATAVREVTEGVSVPTFDQAQAVWRRAQDYLRMGLQQTDPVYRDMDIRNAFNALFDAARLAVMCFLDTEKTRRRQLPAPLDAPFRRIIAALHVACFDGGQRPDEVKAAFARWRDEVAAFIDALRAAKGHASLC